MQIGIPCAFDETLIASLPYGPACPNRRDNEELEAVEVA
jgi:hypothetical protein